METEYNGDEIQKLMGVWHNQLVKDHCTPLLILGVGQDQNSGQVQIYIPEGVAEDFIVKSLMDIARQMARRQGCSRN